MKTRKFKDVADVLLAHLDDNVLHIHSPSGSVGEEYLVKISPSLLVGNLKIRADSWKKDFSVKKDHIEVILKSPLAGYPLRVENVVSPKTHSISASVGVVKSTLYLCIKRVLATEFIARIELTNFFSDKIKLSVVSDNIDTSGFTEL